MHLESCHLEYIIVVGRALEELLCQSPTVNVMLIFFFSADDEGLSHTLEEDVKVEMQQFDELGYYFNLLCCMYDEFTATVCMSTMLMKRD